MISYKKYAGNACFRRLHRAQKKDGYPSPCVLLLQSVYEAASFFPMVFSSTAPKQRTLPSKNLTVIVS